MLAETAEHATHRGVLLTRGWQRVGAGPCCQLRALPRACAGGERAGREAAGAMDGELCLGKLVQRQTRGKGPEVRKVLMPTMAQRCGSSSTLHLLQLSLK